MKQKKGKGIQMKIRSILSTLALILVVFGLFTTCKDQMYTTPPFDPEASFDEKLSWLVEYGTSGGSYTVEVDSDQSISPTLFFGPYPTFSGSYNGDSNLTITLVGIGQKRTITLSSQGSMFTVGEGVTLILGDKLELRGNNHNDAPLISVCRGGSLFLKSGAKITGNGNNTPPTYITDGGGVLVSDGGTFTMTGGEISGNTSTIGGGVVAFGTFTMEGGKISSNTSHFGGGGVYAEEKFIMTGGEISGNTVPSSGGGGVYAKEKFIMTGGEISGNTATCGGGVYAFGTFTMEGGKISSNTSHFGGGGVYAGREMSIYTSQASGDGVYAEAKFIMTGGEISGNTVFFYGGGVFIGDDKAIFNKTGGTIYGYIEGDENSNVVRFETGKVVDDGHAVAVFIVNGLKTKNTTSSEDNNLSYDGTTSPVSFNGDWDS